MKPIISFVGVANDLAQRHALLVVSVLVFLSVVMVVAAGLMLIGGRNNARNRMFAPGLIVGRGADEGMSIRYQDNQITWLNAVRPLYQRFVPGDDAGISTLRRKMIGAGFRNPIAVSNYFGIRIVLGMAMFAGSLIAVSAALPRFEVVHALLIAVIGGLFGYFLPAMYVAGRTATRRRSIQEGFPDALDMLMVCVEAGISLESAIDKVAAEIGKAHPVLGDEMNQTRLELRAGKGRQEALRNLGERTGVEDIRTLVMLLAQSDAMGTSIAPALRVHSFEMRAKRLLRAEEKAHKIPVRLSFPLIFGLLPVLMAVVLAPAFFKAVGFIMPVLSQGMPSGGG